MVKAAEGEAQVRREASQGVARRPPSPTLCSHRNRESWPNEATAFSNGQTCPEAALRCNGGTRIVDRGYSAICSTATLGGPIGSITQWQRINTGHDTAIVGRALRARDKPAFASAAGSRCRQWKLPRSPSMMNCTARAARITPDRRRRVGRARDPRVRKPTSPGASPDGRPRPSKSYTATTCYASRLNRFWTMVLRAQA
jgi:hypothetical protein